MLLSHFQKAARSRDTRPASCICRQHRKGPRRRLSTCGVREHLKDVAEGCRIPISYFTNKMTRGMEIHTSCFGLHASADTAAPAPVEILWTSEWAAVENCRKRKPSTSQFLPLILPVISSERGTHDVDRAFVSSRSQQLPVAGELEVLDFAAA